MEQRTVGWVGVRTQVVLQRGAAAQPHRGQRCFAVAGELLQPPRHRGDHCAASLRHVHRVAQGAGDLAGAAISVVDHQAPIHDQDDPERSELRRVRAQRQVEHGGIQRCRLARSGRQVQDLRPLVLARELLDELLLPRKRGVPVDSAEERGEVGRGQRHVSGPRRGGDTARAR